MKRIAFIFTLFIAVLSSASAQQTTAFAGKPAVLTAIGQSADF